MKTCGACAKQKYEVRHPKTGKLYGVSLKKAKKIEKKVKRKNKFSKIYSTCRSE